MVPCTNLAEGVSDGGSSMCKGPEGEQDCCFDRQNESQCTLRKQKRSGILASPSSSARSIPVVALGCERRLLTPDPCPATDVHSALSCPTVNVYGLQPPLPPSPQDSEYFSVVQKSLLESEVGESRPSLSQKKKAFLVVLRRGPLVVSKLTSCAFLVD